MDNPLLIRGIERILIVLTAALFAFLGYRLFRLGHDSGPGKLTAKTKVGEVILSGTGPGLFFMAFGGLVLLAAVFHGDYRYSETTTTKTIGPPAAQGAAATELDVTTSAVAAASAPASGSILPPATPHDVERVVRRSFAASASR